VVSLFSNLGYGVYSSIWQRCLKILTSGSREPAAVHYVQTDLANFSDETGESDDDPAVVRTVETLSVAGDDVPASVQEKETRSSGGIPSQ
jgi:hypothetical protein